MNKFILTAVVAMFCSLLACDSVKEPSACGPVPSENQMNWQEMEYYAFIHFSMNTFTDIEWGYGDVAPEAFNPSEVNCEQWAKICKDAGMKGIIMTAKHHDGFCLWPTATTDYSVSRSPWRDGKGDLVRELSDACKKNGLKFGIYLSPWDRNCAVYGTSEYIPVFREQLRELLTNYGDVFEVWFDGANGGTGYYGGAREDRSVDRKNYYDWPNTYKLVYELQPNAMIFGDGGPDVRWCGNEEGWVGETNWSTLKRDEVWPGWPLYEQLRYGHEDGNYWVPAEVNVSTRPGWFYHASEDHKVKTLPQLSDIYYQSVGRNGTLLINFPVDRRGLIHETDAEQILKLAETVKADFADNLARGRKAEASEVRGNSRQYSASNVTDGDKNTYWATDDSTKTASLTIDLGTPTAFNRFLVQEYIRLGQRVRSFSVEALVDGNWQLLDTQTTIGYKRILRLPTVKATKVRFTVTDAKACPLISNIELYCAPKVMSSPGVTRNKEGVVSIKSADKESKVYFTVDGTQPSKESALYTEPFALKQKARLQTVAYDSSAGKYSPVTTTDFDICAEAWKIAGTSDARAYALLDGQPGTCWHQQANKMPVDLVIDLGNTNTIKGFTYLPDQQRWAAGIVFNYEFYTSADGNSWKLADAGEFSNIKNNPLLQTKTFQAVQARFVKLRALSNTDGNNVAGYAEFGIITE